MSSFKPRKVDSAGFFLNDHREEEKFWYLDRVVQPVVGVGINGRFHSFGFPLELIEETVAGNVGWADYPEEFLEGQIWEIESFTILSNLGADYTGTINGVSVGTTVTVAAAASATLMDRRYTFDAPLGIAVTNGAAGDAVTLRARRIA